MNHTKNFLAVSLYFLLSGFVFATYPVSRVYYEYGSSSEDLPSLSPLNEASVQLREDPEEIGLDSLIRGASLILELSHKDLFKLSEVPLHFLKSKGFAGMVAFPDPNDIDPVSGKDLRPSGDTALVIKIWVSRLDSVAVQATGLNDREEKRITEAVTQFIEKEEAQGKPVTKSILSRLKAYGTHASRSSRVLLSATDDQPGMVKAVMKVKEREDRPNFLLSASNAGSESTGEWLFSGSYMNDQLTGIDDALTLSYISSNTGERQGVNANYYIPLLAPEVVSLGVGVGYSTYDASTFAHTLIDFEGDSVFADLSILLKPLSWRNESAMVSLESGLNFENVSAFNSISGSARFTTLTPRLVLSVDSKGENRLGKTSLTLKGNLSSIDDADQLAMGGDNTTDTYSRFIFQHLENWKIGRIFAAGREGETPYLDRHLMSLRFEASWALSSRRHLPQHQFITGGSSSVRGYPESLVAGDSGYLFSLEYRIPYLLISGDSDEQQLAWSLVPFLDIGATKVNDARFYESSYNLFGMGLGLEFQLPYGAYARIDFAKPLKELSRMGTPVDGTEGGDYRVHGNLSWKF